VQLDRARVAICERSWLDNLDLALHVMRAHSGPLTACALAGILPWAALNVALVARLYGMQISDDKSSNAFMVALLLVMLEAPLATAPLTLFLGQALFLEKPAPRQIVRGFWHCLPQLVVLQGLLRIVLVLPILTWFIPYVLWPFLSEVILLERNPLIGRRGRMSTLKRNAVLHRGNSGDFLGRGVGAAVLALLLIGALWVTQGMVLDWLFGFQAGWIGRLVAMQCVIWLVAAYFTVARFLCYLDQRIRIEGWEVELFFRAQRQRLERPIA
jgi:hypothetical protein